MPRVKNVMSKVYKSPRRPFEKERLDQVCTFTSRSLSIMFKSKVRVLANYLFFVA
ncbi:unnamed protein product [Brugia pahangi]|uniref:30S ribosomal protein S18 n=1 Tax=Brugia pahangi TaxID=6280 RepID=A0A0N4T7B2_BRUPA|nr:unnamed protein product [Brugia pahangi]